jgi:hypothetical protein
MGHFSNFVPCSSLEVLEAFVVVLSELFLAVHHMLD